MRQGLASASDGPLTRTLRQLYSRSLSPPPLLPWRVLWNDQSPSDEERGEVEEPYPYFAHSKGVLAMDDGGGGFFLSHSAPRFPNDPEKDSSYAGLALAQQRFSQHFLCVSLDGGGMENLTWHLSRSFRPRAFSVLLPPAEDGESRRPSSLESAAAFASGTLPLSTTSSAEIETAAGRKLLLLATAGGGGGEGEGVPSSFSPLWDTVVASAAAAASSSASPSASLLPPLAVQSWIRAEGSAPPKCRTQLSNTSDPPLPSVLGVRSVSFGNKEEREEEEERRSFSRWSSEEAHAKWGVALGNLDFSDFSFACVGDTNRDAPGRAGGATCVRWPGLRRLLASAVEEVDACGEEEEGARES